MTNFCCFQSDYKLVQAMLTFTVQHLINLDDLALPKSIFHSINKKGDGILTRQEFIEGFEEIGGMPELDEEQLETIFDMADKN